ncbi:DUF6316 family protein [Marinobacter caseinilyticus]|uniref:DUF6316 family protein n=1 Tax=Marinobacter caseinilyticus TaxID=2692195 RepID=UPI0014098009|nr:DUF6316 family protein [Marinobacter caseinilyticus]
MNSIDPVQFRSNRFIETRRGWVIRTREQTDIGPYIDRESAESALHRYIASAPKRSPRPNTATVYYGIEIHDAVNCHKINCAICLEAQEAANEARSRILS